MKKPYIEPLMELVKFSLRTDVLFHSPFESGGENDDWDWNDDHDNVAGSGYNPADDIYM